VAVLFIGPGLNIGHPRFPVMPESVYLIATGIKRRSTKSFSVFFSFRFNTY
jgi:hypothetical protein